MEIFKAKCTKRGGPERIIQDKIIDMLLLKSWYIKETHGNEFQSGLPDLYCCHKRYGARWIEVKNPKKYSFTPAQLETFPMFAAHGVGVWILVAGTEHEYQKLFQPMNWHTFVKAVW